MYANEPPRWVAGNVPRRTAAATHASSAGSGELFTVTPTSAPAGDT